MPQPLIFHLSAAAVVGYITVAAAAVVIRTECDKDDDQYDPDPL